MRVTNQSLNKFQKSELKNQEINTITPLLSVGLLWREG
jgi:hypothetical protein